MHVPGLQYFPTKSLYTAEEGPSQRDVIYQQAFTFNSDYSTTANSGQKVYLTVPLNKFIEVDETSNPDKKFNTIIVSGYAAITAMNDSTVIKFVHTFVTDWNLYVLNNIISYTGDSQNYFFPGQNTNTSNAWSPIGLASNWVNGATNVIGGAGGTWDEDGNTPVGWSCRDDDTGSSQTGPSGGVDVNGNPPFSPLSSQKYLFVECTGFNSGYVMITRTPGVNYSQAMLNSVTNNLTLSFYVHGYSTQYSNMGNLGVYISPTFPTNKNGCNLLHTVTPPGLGGDTEFNQTTHSSPYQKIEISLNAYKNIDSIFYIYFVSNRTESYRGDMAIDGVQIIESNPNNFNFEKSFSFQESVGNASNSSPVLSNNIIPTSVNGNFTDTKVNFLFQNPAGKALYIKGSYLLM